MRAVHFWFCAWRGSGVSYFWERSFPLRWQELLNSYPRIFPAFSCAQAQNNFLFSAHCFLVVLPIFKATFSRKVMQSNVSLELVSRFVQSPMSVLSNTLHNAASIPTPSPLNFTCGTCSEECLHRHCPAKRPKSCQIFLSPFRALCFSCPANFSMHFPKNCLLAPMCFNLLSDLLSARELPWVLASVSTRKTRKYVLSSKNLKSRMFERGFWGQPYLFFRYDWM